MLYKRVKRGVLVILLLIILEISMSVNVCAFGISTPYLENNILKASPAKDYTYKIVIQNSDEKDYYVDITYSSSGNIATLSNSTIYVPSKSYNNPAYFIITIPKDAKIGQNYSLEYSVIPRTSSTELANLEIKRSIDILVVPDYSGDASIEKTSVETSKTNSYNQNVYNQIMPVLIIVGKYAGIAILAIAAIALMFLLWRVSKKISIKLLKSRTADYTISSAKNMHEVCTLLDKISDEEYELPEIKEIFTTKIEELNRANQELSKKNLNSKSRKDTITIIEKYHKE